MSKRFVQAVLRCRGGGRVRFRFRGFGLYYLLAIRNGAVPSGFYQVPYAHERNSQGENFRVNNAREEKNQELME